MPAAFALTWIGERLWSRFGPDDAARALADKHRESLAQLDAAAALVDSGDGFWAKIGELLQRAAVDRLGEDARGLTRGALAQRLSEASIDGAQVESWKALLDRADAARYGAGEADAATRRSALQDARALISGADWRPRA